jgi:hypothetical protein
MRKLFFMSRDFEGLCLRLDESLETEKIRSLFHDSWYWLHYCFFSCTDRICSEKSSVIRTHLYNLTSNLFQHREQFSAAKSEAFDGCTDEMIEKIIEEIVAIAEYSKEFPICLWICGDMTSKSFLEEWVAELPSHSQIEKLMNLPHFTRIERERPEYMYDSEVVALKRHRNEEAAFNKRQKATRKTNNKNN